MQQELFKDVYRVQRIDNQRGPYSYSNDLKIREMQDRHNECRNTWPGLSWPEKRTFWSHWRYGFSSLKLLKRWFGPGDRKVLHEDGFEIVHFRVPHDKVADFDLQLTFEYPDYEPERLSLLTPEPYERSEPETFSPFPSSDHSGAASRAFADHLAYLEELGTLPTKSYTQSLTGRSGWLTY